MMMYLMMLIAGILLCNALPHLASGLRGERFFTLWAKPFGTGRSSAFENFLWGAANLFVAVFLLTRTASQNVPHGLFAVALGFLAAGATLSILFGKRVSG
ncbi:hypothetical protein [Sphingomonas abietis]|uniref:SdpI family protein n=1 Tax=Sphingomonas abietis TaxID=3012344 RepID=A0ABY7NVT9_9SPHN|nr:hypothetical protein [Sphingomonas abietis]WBO24029.1 hypothetical protein PBT88_07945 [Sphingomonas abietis]